MSGQCPTCKGRGVLPDTKTCALPGCGREFVWQDDARGREHPRADASYCSASCRRAAAMRAYRIRRKAA